MSYNDGTIIFADIAGGKLQVGTGSCCNKPNALVSESYSGEINIPSSFGGKPVTIVSSDSFYHAYYVTGITISSSIREIRSRAFLECRNVKKVTFLPNSELFSIGFYSFGWLPYVTCISIPSSVTSIGQNSFSFCPKLTSLSYCGKSSFSSIDIFEGSNPSIFVSSSYPASYFGIFPVIVLQKCESGCFYPSKQTNIALHLNRFLPQPKMVFTVFLLSS